MPGDAYFHTPGFFLQIHGKIPIRSVENRSYAAAFLIVLLKRVFIGIDTELIKDIIYHSDRGGMQAAVERFYSDDTHTYSFPTIRSYVVIVYYKDGTEENVKEALEGGRIQITDLDRYGIRYYAEPKLIESIIDISQRDQLDTSDALEFFYRDDTYNYSFSSIKSHYIIVRYKDGTEQNVKDALESGKIKISDLDWFGIKYHKEPLENFHE